MTRDELLELAGEREQPIQRRVLDALATLDIEAFKVQNGTPGGSYRVGKRSTPDIIGCLPGGRFLAIEVKKPGGPASAGQLDRIEHYITIGACAFIAESVDDVLETLRMEGILR